MIQLLRAADRGQTNIGWLTSWHSFSFGDYYDPNNMGFRSLRVINDDIIAPSMGFGTHGHRDMEIVTYLLDGALEHRDSLGNGDVLRPGDVQRMSAGSGMRHSEFNPADNSSTHLLQIWLEPLRPGGAPSYEQRHFSREERQGRWCPIISGDNNQGAALPIQADVTVYASILLPGQKLSYRFASGRHGYLHLAAGTMTSDLSPSGDIISSGDALRMSDQSSCTITAMSPCEILLFDLA
jgi:hypothetical protein